MRKSRSNLGYRRGSGLSHATALSHERNEKDLIKSPPCCVALCLLNSDSPEQIDSNVSRTW